MTRTANHSLMLLLSSLAFLHFTGGAAASTATPSAEYHGTIESLVTGRPVAAASVKAYPRLSTQEIRERHARGEFALAPLATVTADEAGRFTVEVASGQDLVLVADGIGHAHTVLGRPPRGPGDHELGSFYLDRGHAASGRVVDEAGKGIEGADLVAILPGQRLRLGAWTRGLTSDDGPEFAVYARSGPDGAFEISGLPEANITLRAFAPGSAPGLVEAFGASREITIRLDEGVSVRGKAVRSDGETPASGAWVLAGGELGWEGAVRAGSDGSFEMKHVRPGRIGLMAAAAESEDVSAEGAAPAYSFEAPSEEVEVVAARPSSVGAQETQAAPAAPKPKPVVIRLREGGAFDARIIDAETRQPLAGARIFAKLDGGARPLHESAGPLGEIHLGGLPAGQVLFYVDAGGHFGQEQAAVEIVAGETRSIAVSLATSASLAGVVKDEAGEPIAGAIVSVRAKPDSGARDVLRRVAPIGVDPVASDSRGRFVFEKLPTGRSLTINVDARSYVGSKLEDLELAAHEAHPPLEVVLDAGASLTGRVVTEAGEPVPNAGVAAGRKREGDSRSLEVRASPWSNPNAVKVAGFGGEALPEIPADARGRFRFDGVRDGIWGVRVTAPGFAPTEVHGLKVEGARGVDAGDIALKPGARIRGSVSDADGNPIPWAQASIYRDGKTIAELRADATGFFESEDLVPGDAVDLDFYAGGYGTARRSSVVPPVEELAVTLPAVSSVSGQVLDERTRAPIRDFEIFVNRPDDAGVPRYSMSMPGPQTYHSDDGRFRVKGVDPGKIEVQARATGYDSSRLADLEVAPGEDLSGLVFRMDSKATVAGRVHDEEGRPVSGAIVKNIASNGRRGSGRRVTTTDAEGAFTLDGMDRGATTLGVERDGFAPARVDVDATEDVRGLDVVLSRGGAIAGVVLDADGGSIAGATVSASAAGTGIAGVPAPATTGPDGAFRMAGFADGRYSLRAEAEGWAPAEAEEVVVREGDPEPSVQLRLSAGASVSGTVTGAKLEELGDLFVTASRSRDRGGATTAAVDATGAFLLQGLAPGSYTLVARTGYSRGRSASTSIEIPEGVPAMEATIAFPSGRRVQGMVSRGGEPLAGASVSFERSIPEASASATTDATGEYAVEGLDDGEYGVFVRHAPTGTSHRMTFTVSGDGEFDIDLPVAVLEGSVRDKENGAPIPSAVVQAKRIDGGGASPARPYMFEPRGYTDATGRFRISGFDDGSYEVSASKEGFGFESRTVIVPPGGAPDAITFDLSRVAGYTFQALDASSGLPLQTVSAMVVQGGGDPLGPGGYGASVVFRGRLEADAEGTFKLATLPPGTYTIVLFSRGEGAVMLRDVEVPSRSETITMSRAGAIEVLCASLEGAETARLALYDTSGRPVFADLFGLMTGDPTVSLGAGGNAVLPYVSPGSYLLRIALPGGIMERPVSVRPGETARVSLP